VRHVVQVGLRTWVGHQGGGTAVMGLIRRNPVRGSYALSHVAPHGVSPSRHAAFGERVRANHSQLSPKIGTIFE